MTQTPNQIMPEKLPETDGPSHPDEQWNAEQFIT